MRTESIDRLVLGWLDRIPQQELQQEILILSWTTGTAPEKCLVPALLSLMQESYSSSRIEEKKNLDKIESTYSVSFDIECLSDLLSDKLDIPYKYRYILWLMASIGVKNVATSVSTDFSDVSRYRQKVLHLLFKARDN